MKTEKVLVAAAVVGGGLWLLSRRGQGLTLFGGSGPSFANAGTSPSPLGPTNAGTNPITALFAGVSAALSSLAFKTSGNAPAIPNATSGGAGASTPWQKPPATPPFSNGPTMNAPTLAGFPAPSPGLYLPNYGDPNYNGNAVDAWMFAPGAWSIPDMSGSNQAGTLYRTPGFALTMSDGTVIGG